MNIDYISYVLLSYVYVYIACSGKDYFIMADSKLVNEHRAWLKDAEKGKTRACICAIAFFVFYSAVAIVNFNFELFSGFLIFVVMLVSLIGSLLLFNGYNAGRFWVMVPEALIVIYTTYMIMQNIDPDVVENPMTSGQIVLIIMLEFLPPLFGIVFQYANFYMRRYYSFMVLYRAKKIYL